MGMRGAIRTAVSSESSLVALRFLAVGGMVNVTCVVMNVESVERWRVGVTTDGGYSKVREGQEGQEGIPRSSGWMCNGHVAACAPLVIDQTGIDMS